jgi:hypothetical protein
MAIATSTAIGLGVAAAGSAYQIYQGEQAKNEAAQAAQTAQDQLAKVTETNQFQDLQIPTLGLDMAQENIQARQQGEIQALRETGAAGVLGGLTASSENARKENLGLAAEAQQAQYQRDLMMKQNAQQLESNRVQRQAGLYGSQLAGAQQARAEGQNLMNAGISGLASAGLNAGLAGMSGSGASGLGSADAAAAQSIQQRNAAGFNKAAQDMANFNYTPPKPTFNN